MEWSHMEVVGAAEGLMGLCEDNADSRQDGAIRWAMPDRGMTASYPTPGTSSYNSALIPLFTSLSFGRTVMVA